MFTATATAEVAAAYRAERADINWSRECAKNGLNYPDNAKDSYRAKIERLRAIRLAAQAPDTAAVVIGRKGQLVARFRVKAVTVAHVTAKAAAYFAAARKNEKKTAVFLTPEQAATLRAMLVAAGVKRSTTAAARMHYDEVQKGTGTGYAYSFPCLVAGYCFLLVDGYHTANTRGGCLYGTDYYSHADINPLGY